MRPQIAEFLKALEETQFLAPDRMRAYQRRLLDVLLRHARSETEFYATRLAPLFRADDSIDWDRWAEIPILMRNEARNSFAQLKARTLPEAVGNVVEDSSSGSTGEAFRHLTTGIQNFGSLCLNERFLAWHELDPKALMAVIWAVTPASAAPWPDGRASKGLRLTDPQSPSMDLSITTPIDKQIAWLTRFKPTYLTTYPSNLREIGRVAHEVGAPLSFDAVLTTGEMISDDARCAIREYFGKEPLDRYGSTEVGHMAATCPHSMKHHVAAELVLIEIADAAGNIVPNGSEGRIIATPFYNLAMPLIRYDTGDHGIISAEPCGCGRTLPTFERILGRERNVFRFPDGTSVWPVLESWRVQKFVPHRKFQVVQVARDRIEYRYVPLDPNQTNDLEGLNAYARAQLNVGITVTPVAVADIKPAPSGKFEDYLRLIE